MSALNLSANGPSIAKSYQSVISSAVPSGSAATSPTYGQWAVFSVSAPLLNAFQQDSAGKESVLKVQSTGEGELLDMIDEFSDGRVMFAFVKIKDPNTSLPKCALIGWCGEGVPERTKGYFTSHLATVEKVLHGYHVQIIARSDRDLTPEVIMLKISEASGSKYSSINPIPRTDPPPPSATKKPAFMPTQSSSGSSAFNPLSNSRRMAAPQAGVDEDGWGEDAPQITRTQLEKVEPAYRPTKVNMKELSSQGNDFRSTSNVQEGEQGDIVKGAYQPVGRVDIASLRKQAQGSGSAPDDRPGIVKGAYEPVGKVDIAAIRARAQQPPETPPNASSAGNQTSASGRDERSSLGSKPTAFNAPERLTAMPKPKTANRFGSGGSTFTGTTAPLPGGFGNDSNISNPKAPVGASRTFADEGGKTPAQLWAEKKTQQKGPTSDIDQRAPTAGHEPIGSPISSQTSGGGGWKSGYTGKSWAAVQTTKTGQSTASMEESSGREEEPQESERAETLPTGGVGAMRDMFKGTTPMGVSNPNEEDAEPSPPQLDISNKPSMGRDLPMPGLPVRSAQPAEENLGSKMPTPPTQPRSPTPEEEEEEDAGSPIRIAMPVSRNQEVEVQDARNEQFIPPAPMPVSSIANEVSLHDQSAADEPEAYDAARAAASNVAQASFGHEAEVPVPRATAETVGKRALVQYDYEKAEDNELELREGEYVTDIEMVDEDWWMGQNTRGETGYFPSNYVELMMDDAAPAEASAPHAPSVTEAVSTEPAGTIATALYDYEAAEDNELSFPEGAKITDVGFPDDDWWSGEYDGHVGLFPSNYVELVK